MSRLNPSLWMIMLAAAFALTSCAGTRSPQAVNRPSPEEAAMRRSIEELKQENDALKTAQESNQVKIAELNRTIETERVEQQRYRNMMSTNFELLEQSVAQTLASREQEPAASTLAMAPMPRQAPLPRQAPTQQSAMVKKPAATSAGAKRAVKASSAKQPRDPPVVTMMLRPAAKQAPTPIANRRPMVPVAAASRKSASRKVFTDPDLTPPAAPQALSPHPEAKGLYEKAFGFFARKDYGKAIEAYQSFLQRFPKDIYSDNAQFWIAESHLREGDLVAAETAYRQVLRNYAHRSTLAGYKTPDSILRIGQVMLKRGETEKSGYYFRNAAERFPETSAGRKAKKELETLRRNTAGMETGQPKS